MDYIDWQSSLSLEQVFAEGESFTYPTPFGDGFIYLTELKSEKNRSALMYSSEQGDHCITPLPFSLRTRVNEYGGKPFWLFGDTLYFANQQDQCIYCQKLTITSSELVFSSPQRVTPKPTSDCILMYTDLVMLSTTKLLVIAEQTNPNNKNISNSTSIRCVDLENENQIPVIVEQGADFYSNLVFSPSLKTIAWVQWNHPLMPWDETHVFTAEVGIENERAVVLEKQQVNLDTTASVCQLHFSTNGRLFFSADFSTNNNDDCAEKNYWNIYCYSLDTKSLLPVTDLCLEFGYPHWQYGDCRISQLNSSTLLTVGSSPTGDQLFLINQDSLTVTLVRKASSTLQRLSCDGQGRALMIELPFCNASRILEYKIDGGFDIVKSSSLNLGVDDVSEAQHISFNCEDGGQAYGFYYPPKNRVYQDTTTPPPLIVMVHGGPTARAYGHFDLQKQFWTSRGFALFDVNHRGSSGYGRNYRDALYENWGELDCSDIVDGINLLVKDGKANKDQICIRGKSAGGYAVLRALTQYPNIFKVGACYYGIGNLVTLAQSTHKFEQHYTDRLIGEVYNEQTSLELKSLFYQRSPIHDIEKLQSSMIVFQGTLDNVVPPAVAHDVVDVLAKAGVEHEYVEYPDEAHGFRQVTNNIDAWSKELAFYQRVLRH